MSAHASPVSQDLFDFLSDLKENNDREWFAANKKRYEKSVKEPLLTLIADFAPFLRSLSPHYRAIPKAVGGSFFRIHRDVRFSANKDPYKTNAAVHFRHALGKDAHAPGYYLHLEPGQVFAGMGVWHPENSVLKDIREAIVRDPESWDEAVHNPGFTSRYHLAGDSLKRAPAGFDADHPFVEDLKRKDFMAVAKLDQADVLRPDFLPWLTQVWDQGRPFMSYLSRAMGVPF